MDNNKGCTPVGRPSTVVVNTMASSPPASCTPWGSQGMRRWWHHVCRQTAGSMSADDTMLEAKDNADWTAMHLLTISMLMLRRQLPSFQC